MKSNINLNLYKVFYCVATTKSFKQASIDLCVSQPAISKQIKNLELILSTKLFYRYNKGIELTNEGKILLSQVEKMNFYLEAAEKHINYSKNLESGELVIGCPSHITSFYLLKYIEEFRKEHPMINIKVFSDSTVVLIDLLSHHKLDFIIDSPPINVNNHEMKVEKIAEFDTILISSIDNNLNITQLMDLNDCELILPLPRSSMRKSFEQAISKYDIKFQCNLSVDTTSLIISSVKKNLGIGYVVKESVLEELNNNQLKEVNINYKFPKLCINLVYNKNYLSFPALEFLKKIH